jgi:hypothetical protein
VNNTKKPELHALKPGLMEYLLIRRLDYEAGPISLTALSYLFGLKLSANEKRTAFLPSSVFIY